MSIQKINELQDKYFYIIDNLQTDKLRMDDAMKNKEKDLKISLSSEAYADLGIIKDFMHYLEMVMNARIKDYQIILTYKKFFGEMKDIAKKIDIYAEVEHLVQENSELRDDMNKLKTEYILKESRLLQAQAQVQKQKQEIQIPQIVHADKFIPKPAPIVQKPVLTSYLPKEEKEEEEAPQKIVLSSDEESYWLGECKIKNMVEFKTEYLKMNPGVKENLIMGLFLTLRRKIAKASRVQNSD